MRRTVETATISVHFDRVHSTILCIPHHPSSSMPSGNDCGSGNLCARCRAMLGACAVVAVGRSEVVVGRSENLRAAATECGLDSEMTVGAIVRRVGAERLDANATIGGLLARDEGYPNAREIRSNVGVGRRGGREADSTSGVRGISSSGSPASSSSPGECSRWSWCWDLRKRSWRGEKGFKSEESFDTPETRLADAARGTDCAAASSVLCLNSWDSCEEYNIDTTHLSGSDQRAVRPQRARRNPVRPRTLHMYRACHVSAF